MEHPTDILLMIRGLEKLHMNLIDSIRKQYHLSEIEMIIISFLHNNPGKDTARDIVEFRMRPKGTVSKGVDLLIQKKLLIRISDHQDRRCVHLRLTDSSLPIIEVLEKAQKRYYSLIFDNLSESELTAYHAINQKIIENITKNLERKS